MRVTVFYFIFFLLITCAEEENTLSDRAYPRIRTFKVEGITENGATASGEVLLSNGNILDHGFIWSVGSRPSFERSQKISLGPFNGVGKFTANIERSLAEGVKYYVAAYVVTQDYKVIGDPVSFVSLGSKAPVLLEIFPKKATWNDTITLVGKNFSDLIADNIVFFHNRQSQVVKSNADTIWAVVPVLLAKDKSNVSVSFDGNQSTLQEVFQLEPPQITSISPVEIKINDNVEVNGKYFNPSETKLYLGTKELTASSITSSKIIFKVTPGTPSGLKLRIQTGDGNLFVESVINILILYPEMVSVEPSVSFFNEVITINGKNFGTTRENVKVKFDDQNAEVISVNETKLTTRVPVFLASSTPKITIQVDDYSTSANNLYSIQRPQIESVQPLRITVPGELIIKGNYFNPYDITEFFLNDVKLIPFSVNMNEAHVMANYYFTENELVLKAKWKDLETVYPIKLKSPWRAMNSKTPEVMQTPLVFTYNNTIFAGLNVGTNYQRKLWQFNPSADTWTEFTEFPYDYTLSPFGIAIGSKVYFGAIPELADGINYELWSLDLVKKNWEPLDDTPFSSSTTPKCFSIGSNGYAFIDKANGESEFWKYQPSNDQWTMLDVLPFMMYETNNSYVVGNDFFFFDSSILRKYNSITNQWTEVQTVPFVPAFSTLNNGKLYVALNDRSFGVYNPNTNEYTQDLNHIGDPMNLGFFITVNGKSYLFGGYPATQYGYTSDNVYEFNPAY